MRRAIAVGALAACLALPAGAGAASYSNPTPLTLAPGPPDSGELFPYPSTIAVGTEQGSILKVTATLVGIAGAEVRGIDALLIGPGGRSILVTDACSAGGTVPDWGGQTVTFDDTVGTAIPETCGPAAPSGTFRPGDYDGADTFPGVAPPYPTSLAAFNGTPPNGLWSLFVVDDDPADPLAINGGWRLDLTTTGAPATPVSPPAKKRKCKRKRKGAAAAKRKRCKKKRRS
jgi:hypothetical protein